MRKLLCALMIPLCLLCGCSTGQLDEDYDLAMDIRGEYTMAQGCSGTMEVVSDYGTRVYTHTMTFTQQDGETTLTVTAPENIAGITATLTREGATLACEGTCLDTGSLTENGITPVTALDHLLSCARGGYIASTGREELEGAETLRLRCTDVDAPEGEGVETLLWFDCQTHALLRGEVSQDGRRVLTCSFTEFRMT